MTCQYCGHEPQPNETHTAHHCMIYDLGVPPGRVKIMHAVKPPRYYRSGLSVIDTMREHATTWFEDEDAAQYFMTKWNECH